MHVEVRHGLLTIAAGVDDQSVPALLHALKLDHFLGQAQEIFKDARVLRECLAYWAAALQIIAEALTLDKMGQYRDRLLHKQQEIVAQQVQRHQTEYLLLVNLVSKYAAPQSDQPKSETTPAESTSPSSQL